MLILRKPVQQHCHTINDHHLPCHLERDLIVPAQTAKVFRPRNRASGDPSAFSRNELYVRTAGQGYFHIHSEDISDKFNQFATITSVRQYLF